MGAEADMRAMRRRSAAESISIQMASTIAAQGTPPHPQRSAQYDGRPVWLCFTRAPLSRVGGCEAEGEGHALRK